MKRAVLAIATAAVVALGVAGATFAQPEGPGPSQAAAAAAAQHQQELPDVQAVAPTLKRGQKAPSQAEMNAAATARMPQLIEAAKITCIPVEARGVGMFNQNVNGKKVNYDAFEVSCKDASGYLIRALEKNGPIIATDCIVQNAPGTGVTATDPLRCQLAGNQHPEVYLQPALVKAGSPCKANGVRAVGKTDTAFYYEMTCASGTGVILIMPTAADAKPQTNSCFQAANSNVNCKLTTTEALEGVFKALTAKANDKCAVAKQRYVMTTMDGDVVEVACADGTGLMVIANTGEFVKGIPCAQAMGYKDGCTLTDARAALTAEAAIYTKAVRKVGFDCDVEKYALFNTSAGKEVVELACKNRKDGAIAILTGTSADDRILNCNRAAAEGFNCRYSQAADSYAGQTADLKSKGKATCVVNGSRPIGRNKENAYIEVTCADGDPGWVMVYPLGQSTVVEVLSCGQAQASGIGGCALPGNKKAG
jgi:hypothetical protein